MIVLEAFVALVCHALGTLSFALALVVLSADGDTLSVRNTPTIVIQLGMLTNHFLFLDRFSSRGSDFGRLDNTDGLLSGDHARSIEGEAAGSKVLFRSRANCSPGPGTH